MPFRSPFDGYYQKIIKPAAAEAHLDALRSDEIYSAKAIMKDIWNSLWRARVVVADVTEKNPNVNYELGLCHALGIPTIIVTKNIDDVPADYRHRRCIVYKVDEAGWEAKLRTDLANTIRAVIADTSNADELDWPYNTEAIKESLSGSVLIASGDARKAVIRGTQIVCTSIAEAFGPLGQRVAAALPFGGTIPVHRGARIAQSIKSANPLEEKGIEEIRRATADISNRTGDGTKFAAILAAGFMVKGQQLIEMEYHPRNVLESFAKAVERVTSYLTINSHLPGNDKLEGVARTAAHGDKKIGQLVVQAIEKAGKDGVIAIETSASPESTLELLEGMRIDRGFLSEYFITDTDRQEVVLQNCLVLVHENKISSMKDLLPVLEAVAKSGRSLLVVADDVDGEALATLVLNKLRGTVQCVAVRSPGYADRRKHLLEDIAILTGANAFMSDVGIPLQSMTLRDLGVAEKVRVTRDETTIIGGAGAEHAIKERAKAIRARIEHTVDAGEREKLQQRLAMLIGRIAVLRAGGITDADIAEETYKLESALHSTRWALEHGCVPGGGIALLNAAKALEEWRVTEELDVAVKKSIAWVLEQPTRSLLENAKRSPTQMLAEIQKSTTPSLGFNTQNGQLEDLMAAGVIDAVKPLILSVEVAFSHARAVLQTSTWDVSPQPERRTS